MAKYRVVTPQGTFVVNAPENATQEQVEAYARLQISSGKLPESYPEYSATDGMSGGEKFLAGAGKAYVDTGRGVKQLLNIGDQDKLRAEIDESKKRDAPLLQTGAGAAGNVTGHIALAAPAMILPGANTLAGATLAGAGMGALQPTGTGESPVTPMVIGGAAGAGGNVAGRVLPKVVGAGKAAVQPFYDSGRMTIVGKALRTAAGDKADEVAAALRGSKPLVPGSLPTTAQASRSPGLAALERTASATDPVVVSAFSARRAAQNTARTEPLREMAGSSGKREFHDAARRSTADKLYKEAFDAGIAPQNLTPELQQQMQAIMGRPSIQAAMKEAVRKAKEQGIELTDATSLQGLHYVKKALDDLIEVAPKDDQRLLMGTKEQLVGLLQKASPKYARAMAEYEAMSKPINQMDVAGEIAEKSINPLTGELQPQAYARALSDKSAARGTGFGGATIENTMSPEQVALLNAIKEDAASSVFARDAGRGAGSDTVQKLAYSNMLDASGVPSWLRGWGPSQATGNIAARAADTLYGRANKELSVQLAEAMLNPEDAARAMLMAAPPSERARIAGDIAKAMLQASTTGFGLSVGAP